MKFAIPLAVGLALCNPLFAGDDEPVKYPSTVPTKSGTTNPVSPQTQPSLDMKVNGLDGEVFIPVGQIAQVKWSALPAVNTRCELSLGGQKLLFPALGEYRFTVTVPLSLAMSCATTAGAVFDSNSIVTTNPSLQPIHTILSRRPLYLTDGALKANYRELRGSVSITWREGTSYASFIARVVAYDSKNTDMYEFILEKPSKVLKDSIDGTWTIRRNGITVAANILGSAYGLSAPVGSYFKFYGGTPLINDQTWHLSAYITDPRLDF